MGSYFFSPSNQNEESFIEFHDPGEDGASRDVDPYNLFYWEEFYS